MASRRDLIKYGLAAGGSGLIASGARAQNRDYLRFLCPPDDRPRDLDDMPPSPKATPFVQKLFVPPVMKPVPALDPPPVPAAHQRYDEFRPKKLYEIHQRECKWLFHPEEPYSRGSWVWGWQSGEKDAPPPSSPGPTYVARYGEPVLDIAIRISNLIILAVPVDKIVELLPVVLENIKTDSVVMDVGSTKEKICEVADMHPNRKNFVATHPIAGTENTGPNASLQGLFEGKPTIICNREKSGIPALKKVEKFYKDIGMKIIFMNAGEHDLHLAYVSHLSHISSFMLGTTVLDIEKNEKTIFDLAGSGFASTVRLAKSSPAMWAPIFEQNSQHLSKALEAYIENLKAFKKYIEIKAVGEMYSIMERANEIRRVLKSGKLSDN